MRAGQHAAFFVQRYGASYIAELQAFFSSQRSGQWDPSLATGEDGLIGSRLAEAAVESWRTQSVVPV